MTDNMPPPSQRRPDLGLLTPLRMLIMCLMFLTRLPMPFSRTIARLRLTDSMGLFAVAGALIGCAIAGLLCVLHWLGVPSTMAAVLACGASVLITGALHEDGLADVADGFGGGKDRQARLEIMRDSRIGSFGTIALIIVLALKVLAFAELTRLPAATTVILVAAAAAFSRAMMVDLMWSTRPARTDGLSHMVGRPERPAALIAILSAIGILVFAGYMFRADGALFAVAVGTGAAALVRFTAIRLIDGQTGDVCGTVQVLTEIAMLTVFASMVR